MNLLRARRKILDHYGDGMANPGPREDKCDNLPWHGEDLLGRVTGYSQSIDEYERYLLEKRQEAECRFSPPVGFCQWCCAPLYRPELGWFNVGIEEAEVFIPSVSTNLPPDIMTGFKPTDWGGLLCAL